jgi:hypothetical protein
MANYISPLITIAVLMRQMETTILGLRHLRAYLPSDAGVDFLDEAIEEGEALIADIRRRLEPSLYRRKSKGQE